MTKNRKRGKQVFVTLIKQSFSLYSQLLMVSGFCIVALSVVTPVRKTFHNRPLLRVFAQSILYLIGLRQFAPASR